MLTRRGRVSCGHCSNNHSLNRTGMQVVIEVGVLIVAALAKLAINAAKEMTVVLI